jgi:hypothetical protein
MARCSNIFFCVLFVVFHAILLPVALTTSASSGDGFTGSNGLTKSQVSFVQLRFTVAAVLASLFGVMWGYALFAQMAGPGVSRVFVFAQAASSFLLVLQGFVLCWKNEFVLGVFLFALAFGNFVWFKRAQEERLLFVAQELKLVARIIFGAKRMLWAIAALTLVQLGVMLLWGSAIAHALGAPLSTATTLLIFLAVSFRWISGILKHVATTVVAVVVTSWLSRNALRHSAHSLDHGSIPVGALVGDEPVPTLRGLDSTADPSSDEEIDVVLAEAAAVQAARGGKGRGRRPGAGAPVPGTSDSAAAAAPPAGELADVEGMSDVTLQDILPFVSGGGGRPALPASRVPPGTGTGGTTSDPAALTAAAAPLDADRAATESADAVRGRGAKALTGAQAQLGAGFVQSDDAALSAAASDVGSRAPDGRTALNAALSTAEAHAGVTRVAGDAEEPALLLAEGDVPADTPVAQTLVASLTRSFGAIAAGALLGAMACRTGG